MRATDSPAATTRPLSMRTSRPDFGRCGSPAFPWAARHGLDNAGFQAEFDSQTSQGLRLVDVSGYEINGADYYTATYDASPTAFWISHHNMSRDAYQAAFNENGAAGYMLANVAGYGVGGQDRYAAIWTADAGPTGGTVGREAVDNFATDALAAAGVPGVSVAIAKDGLLVYAKGYGVADLSTGEAMTVQHRLRIASVSKPITATAIVQLAENGVITLDDPVFGDNGWLGAGTAPSRTLRTCSASRSIIFCCTRQVVGAAPATRCSRIPTSPATS